MSDLAELLERVRAATGPDRELDAEIERAVGEKPRELRAGPAMRPMCPTYSFSIDASLALTERVLPGWWWLREDGQSIRLVGPDNGEYHPSAVGRHHLVPMAIIAATLVALIAAQDTHP